MSKEPTRAELQKLLEIVRSDADFWNQKYLDEKNRNETDKAAAEAARPNRFAITCRITRNDGTVDIIQNIIPRMEDNESMTIAIHPAAVVNG